MYKFKVILTEVSKPLKEFGFKKYGSSFLIEKGKNIGIINFQKSRNSNADRTIFTINIGVYCGVLKILDPLEIKSKPVISDCHWKIRIRIPTNNLDYWWEINDSTSIPNPSSEIIKLLENKAVPEINNHITHENIIKYWLKGIGDGLSEQQMNIYLVAMLKEYNNPLFKSKVSEIVNKYKGKPFYNNVKENLSKLGITEF